MPADARATEVVVREATPDEYPAIGELTVRAYATLDEPLQGGPIYAAYERELRDVAGRAETCAMLVAVYREGALLGAVTYVPGPGTPWSETERDDEAGFRALAVSPEARGRGVGRMLATACVDRARADGRAGVSILSRPAMTTAHHLYESLGFERDRSRDWEFEPGEWLWSYVLTF